MVLSVANWGQERESEGDQRGRAGMATALIMPSQSSVLRPVLCRLFLSEVARLGVNGGHHGMTSGCILSLGKRRAISL